MCRGDSIQAGDPVQAQADRELWEQALDQVVRGPKCQPPEL